MPICNLPPSPFPPGGSRTRWGKRRAGCPGRKRRPRSSGIAREYCGPSKRVVRSPAGVLKVPGTPELCVVLLSHLGETLGSDSLTEACSGQALVSVWGIMKLNETGPPTPKSTQLESQRWLKHSLGPYECLTQKQQKCPRRGHPWRTWGQRDRGVCSITLLFSQEGPQEHP